MRLEDMQARRWRTTRDLSNGYVMIPAGTVVEITYKRAGLNLRSEPCGSCGVAVHVSRCSPGDVEEIPADEPDARREAAERIRRFIEAWQVLMRGGLHTEEIYDVRAHPDEDDARSLLLSDLQTLVDTPRRASW